MPKMLKYNLFILCSFFALSTHAQTCYDIVFVFPPWEDIFVQDAERVEVFEEAKHFHNALLKTYSHFGMRYIEVPKLSIEERLRFITDHV
jgi:predicted ATPase